MMQIAAMTDVGHHRRRNEDALAVRENVGLLLVADGMGGHPSGDVASEVAIDAALEALGPPEDEHGGDDPMRWLADAARAAHDAVLRDIREHPEHTGMGTTLVLAHVDETAGLISVAHVGDSRAYLLEDGEFRRLTQDHVTSSIFGGRSLTQAVGVDGSVRPEVVEVEAGPRARLLLCTDGLTDEVDERRMAQLAGEGPVKQAARSLIDAALAAGGHDNVTVILAELEPVPAQADA